MLYWSFQYYPFLSNAFLVKINKKLLSLTLRRGSNIKLERIKNMKEKEISCTRRSDFKFKFVFQRQLVRRCKIRCWSKSSTKRDHNVKTIAFKNQIISQKTLNTFIPITKVVFLFFCLCVRLYPMFTMKQLNIDLFQLQVQIMQLHIS